MTNLECIDREMPHSNTSEPLKKKIFHLITSDGVYGAEVMLLNLIAQQIKIGIAPVLGSIGRKGEGEKPIEALVRHMEVPVFRFTATKGIDLLAGAKIIRWAKENKISIIHTHGYKPNLLVAFFPRWWRRIPILRTLHGWTNPNKYSRKGVYQLLDIFSLRFTDALFAVSEAMLKKPPHLNTSLNVQVIENGIAEPQINSTTLEKSKNDLIYSFCTNSHMLLSIGRLSEEKGFANLILGVARLVREGVDIKLCIIGEGPQREQLESLIRKQNLQDEVLLAGYRENAYRFMPFFDTYILSSYTEGLPITILEAMHMGVPIVATRVGGVPEVLDCGNAGSFLCSNDPTEIYTHLKMFVKNIQKRKDIIQKAKVRAKSIYSAEIMGQKYKNAYLKLLALS